MKSLMSLHLTQLLLCIVSITVAHCQTFTVLHTFQGNDGAFPNGGLIADGAGNLYGTTSGGGVTACSQG